MDVTGKNGRKRDSLGVWDGQVHTAIFKMDNQQGPTMKNMELGSMLYSSLDWYICICMAESLHCSPETPQQ